MNTVVKLETPPLDRPPVLTIRAARAGDLMQLMGGLVRPPSHRAATCLTSPLP